MLKQLWLHCTIRTLDAQIVKTLRIPSWNIGTLEQTLTTLVVQRNSVPTKIDVLEQKLGRGTKSKRDKCHGVVVI